MKAGSRNEVMTPKFKIETTVTPKSDEVASVNTPLLDTGMLVMPKLKVLRSNLSATAVKKPVASAGSGTVRAWVETQTNIAHQTASAPSVSRSKNFVGGFFLMCGR